MSTISLFEKELQQTLFNLDNGIVELASIREKYQDLIAVQSEAMRPLEVATGALNDMVNSFNQLQGTHLRTLENIQDKFSESAKSMCNSLGEHTKEMVKKAEEAQNSFCSLKEVRDDLLEKATEITKNLHESEKKFVKPFKLVAETTVAQFEASVKDFQLKSVQYQSEYLNQIDEWINALTTTTLSQFDSSAADLHTKIEQKYCDFVTRVNGTVVEIERASSNLRLKIDQDHQKFLSQVDKHQIHLSEIATGFQHGVTVLEQGVFEMNKLNQQVANFVGEATQTFNNFLIKLDNESKQLSSKVETVRKIGASICFICILLVILVIALFVR